MRREPDRLMSYDWDFYFAQIEQQPASIMVDVGLREAAPDLRREHLYWVLVRLNEPSPEGMTTSLESIQMGYIEDLLTDQCSRAGAQFVGRITTAGRREFYYYAAHNAPFTTAVHEAMRKFPAYQFELGDQDDPNWSHYRDFLYPDPEARQTIENRKVILRLQSAGDNLEQSRAIRHFINFRDMSSRAEFVALAQSLGYTTEQTLFPDREQPFGLVLERIESAQPVDIDTTTLLLYRHAVEFEGDYDGWESPVVRPPKPVLTFAAFGNFWKHLFGIKS